MRGQEKVRRPSSWPARYLEHVMSRTQYTVLQVGTYSSRNKGDAAMEVSTARALQGGSGGVRVVISSPFPELDASSYPDYRVTRSSRRRLIWGTLLLGRAFAWQRLKRHTGLDAAFLVRNDELRGYLDADLVVDLSGDMLTEDYGIHVAYSHYLPILTGMALGKPVAICAQSIGPFKWTRALSRRILNKVQLVTARDPITYDYLQSIGVDNPELRLTADMAFLLEPASNARVDAILRDEGVELTTRATIGVSLSGLIKSKFERYNPAARSAPFVRFFARLLDTVATTLDCNILFVSHVTGPAASKDDRIISKEVQAAMLQPAHVLSGDYQPQELKGIIARTQLFFGARMHANIAALSSAVPTVAISYSHKTQGIMGLMQQDERVVRIGDLTADQCLQKLRETWQSRQQVAEALRARLPDVQRLSERNVEMLLALLEQAAVTP
jgi:colanic acid/amylovoran biosynthesis protein